MDFCFQDDEEDIPFPVFPAVYKSKSWIYKEKTQNAFLKDKRGTEEGL